MSKVGFIKRSMVMIYDALLLFGVVMVGYGLLYLLISILPATFDTSIAGSTLKIIYLVSATYGFYAWFWTHGGQTLGMKVWNIYLVDNKGKFINWRRAAIRYLCAIMSWGGVAALLYLLDVERWYLAIGLGFTWVLVNKNKLTWHDRITRTHLVQMPKKRDVSNNSPNHKEA